MSLVLLSPPLEIFNFSLLWLKGYEESELATLTARDFGLLNLQEFSKIKLASR